MIELPRQFWPSWLGKLSKKRTAGVTLITPGSAVSCLGTFWDGGTRYHYSRAELTTGKLLNIESQRGPREFGGGEPHEEILGPGFVLVRTGTFCGKPSRPHLWVRTDSLQQLLGIDGLGFDMEADPGVIADKLEEDGRGAEAKVVRSFSRFSLGVST